MRADLLDLLLTATAAGWLSTDEAGLILRAYDAGDLTDDAVRALLPLPTREAALILSQDALTASLYRLHLLAGLSERAARSAALGGTVRVVEGQRYRAVVRVVEDYDARAFRATRRLADGGDVAAWQRELGREIRSEILSNAQLGLGRDPLPSEAARISEILNSEAGYLARFADHVASRRALAEAAGDPSLAMSEKQIRARAQMYGADSRALFYEGIEGRRGEGYVVRYEARDDGSTCPNCISHARGGLDGRGIYALGTGPMPGRDCRAKNRCRCRRVVFQDAAAYARLTDAAEVA